jgi:TonB family protein
LIAALPELATQAAAPLAELAPAELPVAPNVVEAKPAEPPAVEQPEPAPAGPESSAPPNSAAIESPSFWQLEDDVSLSERPHRGGYRTEPELLSILDPAPAPEPPDPRRTGVLAAICAVSAAMVGVIFSSSHHVNRFSPPAVVRSPANTSGERVYRVGGDVTVPVLIHSVQPQYTAEALDARLEGTVVLYAWIDPSGNAVNLHVQRGLGMGLNARAIEAASQWRFQPGMKNGTPVTVETNLELNFRLP